MSKDNILSVEDLYDLAKDMKLKHKLYVGFTYDEIYKLIKDNKGVNYYIFNLLGFSHLDNEMGHYIACIIDSEQKKIIIYTCYGITSYEIIKMFYSFDKYHNYEIYFDLDQQQKINSNSCGWYCLRWLKGFEKSKKEFDNIMIVVYDKGQYLIKDFIVSKNWNVERYKKYTKEYLKRINKKL